MITADEVMLSLGELEDPQRAAGCMKYFRTGSGGYGEGDFFLGIPVPRTRELVRKFRGVGIPVLEELLGSRWHEARLFALLALGEAFKKGDENRRKEIFDLYIDNTAGVNNWDLVDSSAPHIAGAWLWDKDRGILKDLALSSSIWERRISIIATHFFIRRNDFADTLSISDLLLNDTEDLIHKAVGWMLREVGGISRRVEEEFLRPRCNAMPRTMLRYAIEKFEPELRKQYLSADFSTDL